MKQIDKIVWQLDVGDFDKPFDVNNREVRVLTRSGLATRPKQTSTGPIRKLNPRMLAAPAAMPQPTKSDQTQESNLPESNPSTNDKGKVPLKPIAWLI